MTKTELLKGSTISDYEPDWECNRQGCKDEVTVVYLCKKFCNKHWSEELGFRKEK